MRARLSLIALLAVAAGCVAAQPRLANRSSDALSLDAQHLILVTVDNRGGQASAEPGSSPHGYEALMPYGVSAQARATAAALAHDYHLRAVRQWPIMALKVHCVVFGVPARADRAALLRQLSSDSRVRLAEPLQLFVALGNASQSASTATATDTRTVSGTPAPAQGSAVRGAPSTPDAVARPTSLIAAGRRATQAQLYNDPYFQLQYGFRAIDADGAQRWSRGEGVTVAIVDTGVDRRHPDLRGQVVTATDFIDAPTDSYDSDRHGTGVAGIVGAVANNRLGIVGVAPAAHILSYKACEPLRAGSLEARCNSFTLALALAAAIQAHVQIVNLSLAGPADGLLAQLVTYGQRQGMLFVGAVPQDGQLNGFPLAVPGVIGVDEIGRSMNVVGVLHAPGREILSLTPGGGYDFVSGSSFAAAHVSGALALLRARMPHRSGAELVSVLQRTSPSAAAGAGIDVCAALHALEPRDSCSGGTHILAATESD